MTTLEKSPVTAAQVATWTGRDPLLSAVVRFVQQGWPDSPGEEYAVYFRRKEELSVQAGCLIWGSRVIIPTPGREAILSELHGCHPGIVRMKAVARSFVWWPGIDDEILAKVRSCEVCQQQRNAPHTAQLHPWEWPGQPWHRIHVDYRRQNGACHSRCAQQIHRCAYRERSHIHRDNHEAEADFRHPWSA